MSGNINFKRDNLMKSFEYDKIFPFKKVRNIQNTAIDFALNEFLNNDKRFVIIEAGTGVGKSAIGLTVARYLNSILKDENYDSSSYFLTTQKILQQQYMDDFGHPRGRMKSIKSSTNYTCRFNPKNSCADSLRALKIAERNSKFFRSCAFNCCYKKAKEEFIGGSEGVTNFSYFLAETQYAGKLKPRQVLVVDEAHNADLELSKFIEIGVSERFAKQVLKLKMPDLKTQPQVFKWLKDIYEPRLVQHLKHVEGILEKYVGLKAKIKEFSNFAKKYEMLDKHSCKLHRFLKIYNKNNWVVNIDGKEKVGRKIEFKPIDVAPYSEEMLFRHGKKIILMSATILDKSGYCSLMGIDESDCAFISIPSPFPSENKPILISPVGSMAASKIEKTLPILAKAVEEILNHHAKEKGIVHCHSYKIANYLKNNIKSARIISHDGSNREEMLQKHINSTSPTVLLSPSMTEGVDLKDDISRFQILCKIPYPYLGDKLVKKRMYKWKWWYPLQTAKSLVQAVGRSIRSKTDFAVSYILDEDWLRFYSRNKNLFPQDFRDCLHGK